MKSIKTFALSSACTAIAFVAPTAVLAEQDSQPVVEESAAHPGVPALWKVADEDTTIYMFGTVHMLPDTVDWKTDLLTNALDSSDTLVTELDMNPEAELAMGQIMQTRGSLPEGTTLRSLMSDEQKAKFEAGMATLNVPPQVFDTLKPWLASFALLQGVSSAIGITAENGVETVLEGMIDEDVKREALETIESQIEVFDGLPADQQMAFFLDFAAAPLEGIQGLNTLVDVWAKGDAEGVGNLMNEAMSTDPVLAERLLYNRNKNWAEWIDTRLETPGTVFMAVGAGHLSGTKSVQDYLKEKGIETARIQ